MYKIWFVYLLLFTLFLNFGSKVRNLFVVHRGARGHLVGGRGTNKPNKNRHSPFVVSDPRICERLTFSEHCIQNSKANKK